MIEMKALVGDRCLECSIFMSVLRTNLESFDFGVFKDFLLQISPHFGVILGIFPQNGVIFAAKKTKNSEIKRF